jgi:hypothetical protein
MILGLFFIPQAKGYSSQDTMFSLQNERTASLYNREMIDENHRLSLELATKQKIEETTNPQNVWEYLATFSNYRVLVLIPIILCLLMIVVLIVKPTINLGAGKCITFGSKNYRKQKHVECPISDDFFHVIRKVSEITMQQHLLDFIKKLERQMNYTEQRVVLELKTLFMNNYSELLKNKPEKIAVKRTDFLYYTRLIDSFLREDALNFFRHAYKNNGFINISEAEFLKYTQEKADAFFDLKAQYMDIYYSVVEASVSRQDLKDSLIRLKPEINQAVFDAFFLARQISVNVEDEKKALQLELEEYCDNIVGTRIKTVVAGLK